MYTESQRFPHVAAPAPTPAFRAALTTEAAAVAAEYLQPKGLPRRRVLLVGGSGYIGIPAAMHLLSLGYEVVNLDIGLFDHQQFAATLDGLPGYSHVHGDMGDVDLVGPLLATVSDVVILGGLVGEAATKKHPDLDQVLNRAGIQALLRACRGKRLNKVIFISSCSNYGEVPDDVLADASRDLMPLSRYAASKVALERHLATNAWDFSYTILRFATAFGVAPRMRFDLPVNQFVRGAFHGATLDVYEPETWRPYCHVNDLARAIERVLAAPAASVDATVFNVGGEDNNWAKSRLIAAIAKRLPQAKFKLVGATTDTRNYRVDFSRIRDTLHFTPRHSVQDGIDELVGALEAGFFADYERNRHFYGNALVRCPALQVSAGRREQARALEPAH